MVFAETYFKESLNIWIYKVDDHNRIATTLRCREGRYSFSWITPLYPWYVPYNAECYASRYQVPFFESLVWLDLGWNPSLPGHWRTLYQIGKSWKRYLDDWFIFWWDINGLHSLLQNLHPKIKFTMEHSSKELPFLDILLKNVNNQIITNIYHKLTYRPQYLHFKSPPKKKKLYKIHPFHSSTIITDENKKKKLASKNYTRP